MRLHDIANAAHTEIENQQSQRRQLHQAADDQFMANTRDHYHTLDRLEAHYSAAAFKLACGLGNAPVDAQGQPQEPSTLTAERDGLSLTWRSEDGYCLSHRATWDELEQASMIAEAER